jgi:hypothetical protein
VEGLQSLGLGGWLGAKSQIGDNGISLVPCCSFVVASAVGFTGRFIAPHYFLGECPGPWPLIFAQDCRGRNHCFLGKEWQTAAFSSWSIMTPSNSRQGHRTAG